MKKRSDRGKKPPHGKEPENQRYSGLDDHERRGSKLLSPFNANLGSSLSREQVSWRDAGMPEVLWAVLVRGNLGQGTSLNLFRRLVARAKEGQRDHKETFITHSALSTLPADVFDDLVEPIVAHREAREVLPALLFFESLPDRDQWARHLDAPDSVAHLDPLMRAVAACLDHQSQESTDVRWLKLVYLAVVCERLHFAMGDRSTELIEELRLYPDYGDQRKVRPTIRASELALREINEKSGSPGEVPLSLQAKAPKPWGDQFWRECLAATPCIPAPAQKAASVDSDAYRSQFLEVFRAVAEHFMATLPNTAVDARRDSAFGLAMYGVVLGLGLMHVHQRAEGRIILRSVVEAYITLRFLAHHDNPTMWGQFRNYGNGQAKLAFLKNMRAEEMPGFISIGDLEGYASEDMWQEFVDIDLKSWSNRNLRAMAQEASVKDVYDKHYDWSSGYVHANWASIRDTLFRTCLNPLHRLHRIPFVPRLDMPSVLPDAAKLVNSSLDVIGQLFSPFKPRVKHPAPANPSDDEEGSTVPSGSGSNADTGSAKGGASK